MFSGVFGVLPGATTRPEVRPSEHELAARNGHHWNDNFQRLVDQYGWDSFVYLSFTPVPFDELGEAEQELYDEASKAGLPILNKRRPSANAHAVGYRLSERTRKRQSRAKKGHRYAAKRFKFRAPDGTVHETVGLKDFCRKHHLDMSCMSRVAKSERPHHKGWRKASVDEMASRMPFPAS
jgi:hypothetical protein